MRAHLAALAEIAGSPASETTRYRVNVEASYLAYAVQNVADEERADLWPLLKAFFAKPLTSITTETRRYLADALLGPGAHGDAGDLVVLVPAAELLSPWQFEPRAGAFDLDGLGDSPLATRFRQLVERARKEG